MSELLNIEPEGFVIDPDAKAQWALDKIREARADRDAWVGWYQDKIKEITEQTDFNTMNLERMLMDYFKTVPHKATKTQETYSLPGGKLVLKTQNFEGHIVTEDGEIVPGIEVIDREPKFIVEV